MTPIIFHLPDEAATQKLGQALVPVIQPGMVINLHGDLGAGKTTLIRALLQTMGVEGKIKSPTYTLVEVYTVSSLNLYHFDFYRFNDPEEWEDAGFREYFNADTVCLVEWPEKAGDLLPLPDILISLQIAENGRYATIESHTAKGAQCLERLIH